MKFYKIIKANTISSGALIIAFFAIISKVLGLLRYSLIAALFGTGKIADSYYAAFRIPDFIYNSLVLGAISTAFIPVFLDLYNKKRGKEKESPQDLGVEISEEGLSSVNIDYQMQVKQALSSQDYVDAQSNCSMHWRLTSAVLNTILILLLVVSGFCWVFADKIIPVIVSGFDPERLKITISLTRIMLLSPIIFAVSNILGSVLQALKKFFAFGLAPVLYNIGIVIGILFFYPLFGPKGLGFGVVFGAFLHLLVQIPFVVKSGFKYKFIFAWQVREVGRVVKLIAPRAMSLSANQINHIVNTYLASSLSAGSIVVFYNAYDLESLPISLIAVSLGVASFPVFSELFINKKIDEFRSLIIKVVKNILFIMIPMTIFLILLRAHIVRLILGYGRYNWEDTIRTLQVFGVLSISLVAQSVIPIFARAFYAQENTRTPVLISVLSIMLNIVLSLFLVGRFGLIGLAVSFTISSIFHSILLLLFLNVRIGGLFPGSLIKSVVVYTIGALISGLGLYIALYIIDELFGPIERVWSLFVQTSVSFFVGVFVYILFLWIFGDESANDLTIKFLKRLKIVNSN